LHRVSRDQKEEEEGHSGKNKGQGPTSGPASAQNLKISAVKAANNICSLVVGIEICTLLMFNTRGLPVLWDDRKAIFQGLFYA
jgi:hypothetical protein